MEPCERAAGGGAVGGGGRHRHAGRALQVAGHARHFGVLRQGAAQPERQRVQPDHHLPAGAVPSAAAQPPRRRRCGHQGGHLRAAAGATRARQGS
eukprot:3071083-Pyramimonas_sp.AAC.2